MYRHTQAHTRISHVVKVPGAEENPALSVAIGIDGVQEVAVLNIIRPLQTQTAVGA